MASNSSLAYAELLEQAKRAALAGGKAILEVYNSADFGVELKSDNSPLTKADQAAHEAIVTLLKGTNLPILSEEGRDIPYNEREKWSSFWMVDPLDGTKEFIRRNGEFTVNIALIENNQPVLGIVYCPVLDKLFFGGSAVNGSWLTTKETTIQLQAFANMSLAELKATSQVKIVASRSHLNQETEAFISSCVDPQTVSMGSSLKFLVIAEGDAHLYPRFAPTMEWDTAAANGVLCGLGYRTLKVEAGEVTAEPLLYNKRDLLNPHFLVY